MVKSWYVAIRSQLRFWLADDERPDWDDYGLLIALAASARGDCSRRRVGAAIFDTEHRVVSTGYNGSFPGGPSCLLGECPRAGSGVQPGSDYDNGPGRCVATHAETNAVLFADRTRLQEATIYITDAPCGGCQKLLRSTRIKRVVWPEGEYTQDVHGE
jgi:dCMP deaminase